MFKCQAARGRRRPLGPVISSALGFIHRHVVQECRRCPMVAWRMKAPRCCETRNASSQMMAAYSTRCWFSDACASFCCAPCGRGRVWLRRLIRQPVKPCHLMLMSWQNTRRRRPCSLRARGHLRRQIMASTRIPAPCALNAVFAYCHGAGNPPAFTANTPAAKDRPR